MRDFSDSVKDIFGDRADDFSQDLKEMLEELWREGVRHGLYLERERLSVPQEIQKRRPPRNKELPAEEDPRLKPGKVAALEKLRDKLVEKSELLSVKIESNIDPSPTCALRGEELAKARHRFVSQVEKLDRDLSALMRAVDTFQVHSF